MENLEQRTEKENIKEEYKPTFGDWVPGYGILKTHGRILDNKPNITEIRGLGYINTLFQGGSVAMIGAIITEYISKYIF